MTEKWKKFYEGLMLEIDVEFMACTHGIIMVIVYGFFRWLAGIEAVPFVVIFEMLILSYVIAWIQKGLFLKEAELSKQEYRIRLVFYHLLPFLLIVCCDKLFGWFTDVGSVVIVGFYGVILFYFAMFWLFIKFLYRKDTEELNQQLKRRRKKKE